MTNLESRLNGIDKDALLGAVRHPAPVDGERLYIRAEFAEKFHDHCRRRNIAFADGTQTADAGRRIEGQFHKKVLEPIFYGMLNAKSVPASIINRLTAWETAYFFAGMNTLDPKYHSIPDFARDAPDTIVARLILRGLETLQRKHDNACLHPPKHLSERIESELVLTGEKPIRSQCYAILNRPPKREGPQQGDLFIDIPITAKPVPNADYYLH